MESGTAQPKVTGAESGNGVPTGESFEVQNPATGEAIRRVANE